MNFSPSQNNINATTGTKKMVCVRRAPLGSGPDSGKCLEEKEVIEDSSGNAVNADSVGLGAEAACLEYETETPGNVISEQLNKTLGLGGEKLAVADELNEIVSALLNQLVSKAIGSVAGGLRSLSKPDSANNNQAFMDQFSTKNPGNPAAGYTGYFGCDPNNPDVFCDKPNTDVLTIPIPETLPEQTCDPADTQCIICRDNPSAPECSSPTGGTGTQTHVRPTDNDCDNVDYATLVSVTQRFASLTGITPDQAMLNFDCDPPGIH